MGDEVAAPGKGETADGEQAMAGRRKCWRCGERGHLARDCPNMTEEEGRDRLRTEAGTTRQTRSEAGSGPRIQCTKCGQWGHHSSQCPNGPVGSTGRGLEAVKGLRAKGQALSVRAGAGPSVTHNPPPVNMQLKLKTHGEDDSGNIFVQDDSGNIWWRDH